tara:strand:- start:132 stop:485 length:354 start_codon:yes stop_codon:yes gene_type:complete
MLEAFAQALTEALTTAFVAADDAYVRGVTFDVADDATCTAVHALPGWHNRRWDTEQTRRWSSDAIKKRCVLICKPLIDATLAQVPLDKSWTAAKAAYCRSVSVAIALDGRVDVQVAI